YREADVRQPKVFIGSSVNAHSMATTLQGVLNHSASVDVWSQGVFEQNRGNLENLLKATAEYDFACIFATPDDYIESNGKKSNVHRDNILFEFGLFLSALGTDRVFFIYPRDVELKLPT